MSEEVLNEVQMREAQQLNQLKERGGREGGREENGWREEEEREGGRGMEGGS